MGRKNKRKEIPVPKSPPIKPTILLKRTYMKTVLNQNPNNKPNDSSTSQINNQYGNQNRNIIDRKNVSLNKRATRLAAMETKQSPDACNTNNEHDVDTNPSQSTTKTNPINGKSLLNNYSNTIRQLTMATNENIGDDDGVDANKTNKLANVESTIAQRPRRQVRHKFIKSANVNMDHHQYQQQLQQQMNANSNANANANPKHASVNTNFNSIDTTTTTITISTDNSETVSMLNLLSPNKNMHLVPVLHRLTSDHNKSMENSEMCSMKTDEMPKEVNQFEVDRHKLMNSTKKRGRPRKILVMNSENEIIQKQQQQQQHMDETNPMVECIETETVDDNESDNATQNSIQCVVADDEVDDIMIVEDRDPLKEDETEQFIHEETIEEQMQFVAGELVVEETVDTADVDVTHNDASNDLPIEYSITSTIDDNHHERSIENVDVEEHVPATKLNNSKEAGIEQSETISVSDSLSFLDSDTEQEVIEQEMFEMEEMEFHSENMSKSENLNESIDDVILMHDSRDDAINDDRSRIPNENDNNNQRSNVSAAIEDGNDSQQLEDNLMASLNENTTDCDDDSSTSQDRRAIRSRRAGDRKNYSYRRSYVSRCASAAKLDNETDDGHTQSEASGSPSQNTIITLPDSQNPEPIVNQQSQDGQFAEHIENADDVTEVEFRFKQSTSIRTYQRRKKMSNVKPLLDQVDDDSTSKNFINSETVYSTELTSIELAEAAVNTDEINIKLCTEIGSISESDSNSQIEIEVIQKKRSVGRPSKQRANAISDRSRSEQEIQEQMSQPLLPPPRTDEIKSFGGTTSKSVERSGSETFSTPSEPNDSMRTDTSASTISSVLFEESIIESDMKSVIEVSNIQASTSQSGGENMIETSHLNSEPVHDLSFEVMEVNEPSGENSVEEVEIGIQKIEINTEQHHHQQKQQQQQQPQQQEQQQQHPPDEITEIDDLFDTSLEMEIDAKCESDKLISGNETLAYDDQMNSELCDDVQILDTKPVELEDDEQTAKTEDEVLSALNEIPKNWQDENDDDSKSTRRRSGRIKTINKTKQRVQGLGLVKDKRRTVNFDDDLSNTSIEMMNDLAGDRELGQLIETMARVKTKEELEQERIDRENGLKLFIQIIDNEYRSERTISKEAKKMTCDCFLTQSEIERRELGCGDDCLNRMLLIECGPKCVVGDRCTNKRFQKHENADCTIFKTEKKGYGLIASSYIAAGTFILEYVGEVLNSKQFEKRANDYSKLMNAHYYFMALSSDCVIDATKKGNISRFINHSCDPNAETQKWTVNGELRIGFFSKKDIMPDEEVTFDYQFQRYGKEAQRCYCEAVNCRGWIGGEPDSDDEEAEEEDDDGEEEEDAIEGDENEKTPGENTKKKPKTPKVKKPKDATKKPAKKERSKTTPKMSREFKKHMNRGEIMEDPDLDKEIDVLVATGLKNQVQTLQFSRLMVRAKLQKAKTRLLLLLRDGEIPCRRLFLDYHGLKLVHSWMSDINIMDRMQSLTFRLEILRTLEKLPIKNKTMLQDSKVLSTVQRWTTISEYATNPAMASTSKKLLSANDESSPSDSGSGTPISNDGISSPKIDETSQSSISIAEPSTADAAKNSTNNISLPNIKAADVLEAFPQILEQSAIKGMGVDLLKRIIDTNEKNTKIIEDAESNDKLPDGEMGKIICEIRLLASQLVASWEQLPESFKIPKKLRIEQMKEHEREADESYQEHKNDKIEQKQPPPPATTTTTATTTFNSSARFSDRMTKPSDSVDMARDAGKDPRYRRTVTTLSKHQRRQMFEAKVAQENAERKKASEQIKHEAKCAFFQIDPRTARDFMIPMCVNPSTGQWFGEKMNKIPTPPSHRHIKPPPPSLPTDTNEYNPPPIDLPDLWKFAINEKGQIYYYHTKILIPQWEPPIKLLPLMEEQRFADIDIKMEHASHTSESDHEVEQEFDEEDEDVEQILSNSQMNAKLLLELKSDPILEKYNDDDSSSTDSDDSVLNELEAKYSFIKGKTDAYWANMKKPPNLNEEIAAMAKSDSSHSSELSTENNRHRDEEKQSNLMTKPNTSDSKMKKRKCRSKLVQEIRISLLSEEMKRELRKDSRRYKENKAKLRRQKDALVQKRKSEMPVAHGEQPVRKLKKITEGLPQIPKHDLDPDGHMNSHSFSITSFSSSSRYGNESSSTEPKRSKLHTAFSPITTSNMPTASGSLNPPLANTDPLSRSTPTARNVAPSLTQSIVNKLPSIGHKFVGDTEELIMKNTIKSIIKPPENIPSPVAAPIVSTIRSTPTQTQQQPLNSQLTKKPSHSATSLPKSSSKPTIKKKKTSDELIDVNAAKRIKEKFCSDISQDIVRHLKPYYSKTCTVGQIQSQDDFRFLAKKLTFFVMLKELKYCNNVSVLEVTDSVKVKAREYIKKYMSKFGKIYVRDENEKDDRYEDSLMG